MNIRFKNVFIGHYPIQSNNRNILTASNSSCRCMWVLMKRMLWIVFSITKGIFLLSCRSSGPEINFWKPSKIESKCILSCPLSLSLLPWNNIGPILLAAAAPLFLSLHLVSILVALTSVRLHRLGLLCQPHGRPGRPHPRRPDGAGGGLQRGGQGSLSRSSHLFKMVRCWKWRSVYIWGR